jgi:protein-S-isoprenylcysteine O-methyltransferase Ste14
MLKFVSSAALFVVVAVLVTLAATGALFSASPVLITLQVAAVGLAVWARRSFPAGAFRVVATPGGDGIIQRGPYRLIRHPMYSAALLVIVSAAVEHPVWWTLGLGALAVCVVVVRIVVEERLLRERFNGYAHYVRGTKALIPYVV